MINQAGKRLKRKAFTMVELVMVIVILGIVGMIGTDIIVKMYQGYIKSKIVNDLQQKTELLLEQITKRLQHRVKETTIGRNKLTNNYMVLNNPNISAISPDMIEWIGYDYESYIGQVPTGGAYSTPGWSGFIDVNSPQTTRIQSFTPGSNLAYADSVIKTLSINGVSFAGAQKPVMMPKGYHDSNMSMYGWDGLGGDNNATIIVGKSDNMHLSYTNIGEREIFEQYYLAWSAYGLVPEGSDANDFNLTLKYNYQPWYGESYSSAITKSQVLAEHLSTFRVMQVGDSIRVKICIRNEKKVTGTAYGFCKEKAIF